MKLLTRFLPSSLVGRVYLLYSVTWLAFICSGLGLYYRYEFQRYVDDAQQSASMLVEVVAQTIGESAVIGDYDTIKRTLDKSILNSAFETAQFIDLSGARLSSRNPHDARGFAPVW